MFSPVSTDSVRTVYSLGMGFVLPGKLLVGTAISFMLFHSVASIVDSFRFRGRQSIKRSVN